LLLPMKMHICTLSTYKKKLFSAFMCWNVATMDTVQLSFCYHECNQGCYAIMYCTISYFQKIETDVANRVSCNRWYALQQKITTW